jgi:hypothetical protein
MLVIVNVDVAVQILFVKVFHVKQKVPAVIGEVEKLQVKIDVICQRNQAQKNYLFLLFVLFVVVFETTIVHLDHFIFKMLFVNEIVVKFLKIRLLIGIKQKFGPIETLVEFCLLFRRIFLGMRIFVEIFNQIHI